MATEAVAEERAGLGGWAWSSIVWLSLVLVGPIVLITTWPNPQYNSSLLAAQLIITLYAGARLAMIVTTGRLRPISAMFWVFTYVAMGLAPLAQIVTGLIDPEVLADNSNNERLGTIAVIALGIAGWEIGHLVYRAGTTRNQNSQRRQRTYRPRVVATSRLWLLTLLAVMAVVYDVKSSSGVRVFFENRQAATNAQIQNGVLGAVGSNSLAAGSKVDSSLIDAFGQALPLIAFLCWSWKLRRRRNSTAGRSVSATLAWLGMLGACVIVDNPISNARYWFLTVAVGIIFGMPRLSSRFFRIALPVGVLVAVVLFPYLDYFRYQVHTEVRQSVQATLATKDYDQAQMLSNTLYVTQHRGYTDGKQILTDVLFFIPRSVWSGKGQDTGTVIGEDIANEGNLNLSSSMWSEFWIDFGAAGVLIGFSLVGAAAALGDSRFERGHNPRRVSVLATDIAIPLTAGYSFILLRGPLLQAMSHLAVISATCWLVSSREAGTDPLVTDASFDRQFAEV